MTIQGVNKEARQLLNQERRACAPLISGVDRHPSARQHLKYNDANIDELVVGMLGDHESENVTAMEALDFPPMDPRTRRVNHRRPREGRVSSLGWERNQYTEAGRATGYGMAQDQDHRSVRFKRASPPVVRR